MSQVEDLKTLVERSCAGDLDAFGEVVRRFQDMAMGYAESLVGDFHDAEDVAQESFIDAYLKLGALKQPAAFPGWFRKIVRTHCGRLLRKRRVGTAPLDEGMHVTDLKRKDTYLHEEVMEALRGLPEHQRTATTLFYINGYSQTEIADFLEVPVTTVQKRLHDSRKKLKERMLEMVEETLKEHAPDERFSQTVIGQLLARPRPLEIEGHPVRAIAQTLFAALPEYEVVQGEEVVDKPAAHALMERPDDAYQVSGGRILRPETTVTAFLAAAARKPPIRLIVCGRVFRPDPESALRLKVFHQLDLLHIGEDATEALMNATLEKAIWAVVGELPLRFEPHDYAVTEKGFNVAVMHEGKEIGIAGCGMVSADYIRKCGLDPARIRGFSFGMGIERLAMIKFGIDDIRKLWLPPYVTVL